MSRHFFKISFHAVLYHFIHIARFDLPQFFSKQKCSFDLYVAVVDKRLIITTFDMRKSLETEKKCQRMKSEGDRMVHLRTC
jgi:hypothetical protein